MTSCVLVNPGAVGTSSVVDLCSGSLGVVRCAVEGGVEYAFTACYGEAGVMSLVSCVVGPLTSVISSYGVELSYVWFPLMCAVRSTGVEGEGSLCVSSGLVDWAAVTLGIGVAESSNAVGVSVASSVEYRC